MNTTTSYAQPALIGGLVVGVLSALPIVSIGNFCCCLWIVSGGVVAAYVVQANSTEPMTPADGALAGLLAGLVGAVVHLILSIPIDIVMGPFERSMAQRIMDLTGNAEMRDVLQRYSQREAGIVHDHPPAHGRLLRHAGGGGRVFHPRRPDWRDDFPQDATGFPRRTHPADARPARCCTRLLPPAAADTSIASPA